MTVPRGPAQPGDLGYRRPHILDRTGRSLADVLETMAAITFSAMSSSVPSDANNNCPFCSLPATSAIEHDPDCAYRLARTSMSPMDIDEVRRLVRVLRYVNR